jgi:hypothetical protein
MGNVRVKRSEFFRINDDGPFRGKNKKTLEMELIARLVRCRTSNADSINA